MSAELIWMAFNRSCSTHAADKPRERRKSISALQLYHKAFHQQGTSDFYDELVLIFMTAFSQLRNQLICAYAKRALSETQISPTLSADTA